jgi:hypothetical protein
LVSQTVDIRYLDQSVNCFTIFFNGFSNNIPLHYSIAYLLSVTHSRVHLWYNWHEALVSILAFFSFLLVTLEVLTNISRFELQKSLLFIYTTHTAKQVYFLRKHGDFRSWSKIWIIKSVVCFIEVWLKYHVPNCFYCDAYCIVIIKISHSPMFDFSKTLCVCAVGLII